MKKITQTALKTITDSAQCFTDGGEWAICKGGTEFVSIDGIDDGDKRIFIVELYKLPEGHHAFGPDDTVTRDQLTFVDAWSFDSPENATLKYGVILCSAAVDRLNNF